jgi:hypothetical protein
MKRKILLGILIVGLVGSLALNVILALAYFEEFDHSAGVMRQYMHEARSDVEALETLKKAIKTENTDAIALLDDIIATHSNRVDVDPIQLGQGYRSK